MLKIYCTVSLLLVVTFFWSPGRPAGCAVAEELTPEIVAAIDNVFSEYDTKDQPGASVAVVRHGALVYSRGFGLANLEYDVPVEPDTIFHVASVSKQFTAFAILLLEEKGKLSLDDDIRKHLDWMPAFSDQIRIRHLILHTSGLRDQWSLLNMSGVRSDDVIKMYHIRNLLRRQKELNFKPGEQWMYCNSGYTLLAYIVEEVSGKSLPQFCEETIFKPLQMDRSHFHSDHEQIVPGRAYCYDPNKTGFEKAVLSYANVGATSLFTTAEDLTKWLVNLDTGKVGGDVVRDRMNVLGSLDDGRTLLYGNGLHRDELRGVELLGHGGSDRGFRSYAARARKHGVGVAVLSNRSDLSAKDLGKRILEILLEPHLQPVESESNGARSLSEKAKRIDEARRLDLKITQDELSTCVGHFRMDNGNLLVTRARDGHLQASREGRFRNLIPVAEYEFLDSESGWRVSFSEPREQGTQSVTLQWSENDRHVGKRLSPDEINVFFRPYVGRYFSPELNQTYEITFEDGQVIMEHHRIGSFRLVHRIGDRFRGNYSLFEDVAFERDADESVTGFRVSSDRVKNLWMEKR